MRAEESRALKSILARACVALAVVLLFAAPASAQWRVGGFAGGEHDSSWDEFLVLGADARGDIGNRNLELNPRFTYFLREDVTRFQIDLNLIKRVPLAGTSRIEPYIGTGVAFERFSIQGFSDSAVGFNYIVGGTLKATGKIQVFSQFVYTVLQDSLNNAVLSAGVHYKLSR